MPDVMSQAEIDALLSGGEIKLVKETVPPNLYTCSHCGRVVNAPSWGSVKILFLNKDQSKKDPCSVDTGHSYVNNTYWAEFVERRKANYACMYYYAKQHRAGALRLINR